MSDVVNRLARELADAIGDAVSEDPQVEACHERARAEGYEMRVSLEAVVAFGSKDDSKPQENPIEEDFIDQPDSEIKITDTDRRFLRSLRISAEESQQVE
tara:strand:+ start:1307 stop:1606 length:300 start_codon:yes stop_codon:yes gene_type:complete